MSFKHALGSLIAGLASFCCSIALAGEHPGPCPAGGPIRFAHYEFGLLYTAEGGGIDDDVQTELARRSGCRFEVSLQPRARIWQALEKGELDMAGSGVETPARDRFAWFAHYVVENNFVLLGPRVPADVRSLEDFIARPELRIGIVRSYSFSPFYDRGIERLRQLNRVDEVSDNVALYRMFGRNRFDALISSHFVWGYYTARLGVGVPERIEDWDDAPGTPSGLVLSRQRFSAEQAKAWQALVREMLADGTVRRIVTRYVGPEGAETAVFPGRSRP